MENTSAEETKMNIHKMLNKNSFKEKFHNANKLERIATISYMKKHYKVCVELIKRLHNSEHLDNYITILHRLEKTYVYRNKQFDTLDMMYNFVLEYVDQLIGYYQNYLDRDSMNGLAR